METLYAQKRCLTSLICVWLHIVRTLEEKLRAFRKIKYEMAAQRDWLEGSRPFSFKYILGHATIVWQ